MPSNYSLIGVSLFMSHLIRKLAAGNKFENDHNGSAENHNAQNMA